jgi:transcriptional regulator with XRE-family HTH domain
MKLEQYMAAQGLSDAEMAKLIEKERSLVNRYRRGKIIPSPAAIKKIQEVTGHAVVFNDWFERGPS